MAFSDGFSQTGAGTPGTYSQNFLDPKLVQGLAGTLGGVQQNAAGNYMDFLSNPTAHPLYQAQIGGLLQSLMPGEQRARQGLTDTFRAAGGLRSGAYGREAGMLEGDLQDNRSQTASRLLGQMFPQMTQALQNPMNNIPSLIQSLKLSQGTGGARGASSSGWDSIPLSQGLNTPMSSGGYAGPQQGGTDALSRLFYGGYGGSAQTGVNAPQGPATATPTPYTPYLNPWENQGGGNSITFNPYTGSYETVQPTPAVNPYKHTYSDGATPPNAGEWW
jgi:hypothetical protein